MTSLEPEDAPTQEKPPLRSVLWRTLTGITWGSLLRRETWAAALTFLKTTPVRLVYLGMLTVGVMVSLFFFQSYFYSDLSQLALRRMAIAKWVVTGAAALLALMAYLESRRGIRGRRRARVLTIANLIGFLICYLLLDPPPRVPPRNIELLKVVNAEHDSVRVSPDIDAIARGVELSGETDPFKLGQSTLARNKLDESVRLFDKALLDMRPMERVIAETHFYKAVALSRLTRDEEALRETNIALVLQPHYAPAFTLQCKSLRRLNRLTDALAACKNATREDGSNALAWRETGSVFLTIGIERLQDSSLESIALYEQGLAALKISLQADPLDPKAWNNRCIALYRLGRLPEALAVANQALRLKPDYVDALLQKAVVLKNLGRIGEAISIYRSLTQTNPHDTEAWSNLSSALVLKKDFVDALEAADAATQANPGFGDAWFNKGQILNNLGRFSDALGPLAQAIELNPNDAEAFYEQAGALEHLGRKDEAVAAVKNALALRPDYPDALAMNKRLLGDSISRHSAKRFPNPPGG